MGDAISNVIFGDVVPTGKLPLTFPNKDNEQEMTVAQYPGVDNAGNATYTEGKAAPFATILQHFCL